MSGFAQWLMTEGYRAAETTLVAPFEYGAIIYATVLGIAIWGEWPDVWSLVGDRGADRVGAVYLAPRGDAGAAAVAGLSLHQRPPIRLRSATTGSERWAGFHRSSAATTVTIPSTRLTPISLRMRSIHAAAVVRSVVRRNRA